MQIDEKAAGVQVAALCHAVNPLPEAGLGAGGRKSTALLRKGMLCGCSCDRCKHTANLWHTLSPLPVFAADEGERKRSRIKTGADIEARNDDDTKA